MRRLALAAVLALAVPGVAAAQRAPSPLAVANGKGLFAESCLSCHGPAGQGTSRGPRLRGVGAISADLYLRTGYMPLPSPGDQPTRRRSPFTARQIDALIAYVASLGKGDPVPKPHPERGRIPVGLRLFTEHCAGCHQVVAEGGEVTGARVPPLDQATPVQIAQAVRIGPYVMPKFGPDRLTDQDVASIIRYVEYAKHPRNEGGWGLFDIGPVPEGMVAWLIGLLALVLLIRMLGRRDTP